MKKGIQIIIMIGFLSLFAGCCGLSPTKGIAPFWYTLYDDSEDLAEKAYDMANEYLSIRKNRKRTEVFCKESISKKKLCYMDQLRMVQLVDLLLKNVDDMEEARILNSELKQVGTNHSTFFVLSCDPSPLDFDIILDYLETNRMEKVVARIPNPDGPPLDYPAELFLIKKLQYATGKDFGTDFAAWRSWWDQNKARLTYDSETGRFMSP